MLLSNSAVQFVQVLGIEFSKSVLNCIEDERIHCGNGFIQFNVSREDVKKVVESFGLLGDLNGS